MNKLEFNGTFFKQNTDSPILFAFIADCEEILNFCGVARKEDDLTHHYQRVLDRDRVDKDYGTKKFFDNKENCSPTAIVIGLRNTKKSKVEYTYDKNIAPGDDLKPVGGKITISFPDLTKIKNEDLKKEIKNELLSRICKDDPEIPEDSSDGIELEKNNNDEPEEPNSDAESDSDRQTLDGMHESKIKNIIKRLESLDPNAAITSSELSVLSDVLKPGLIIDGQHRIYGAAELARKHPFLICAVCDASWSEQVFQFCILNLKSVPIPKPFVSSVIGLSLNTQEIEDLHSRIVNSGLKLQDALIMQQIGMNSDSPFYGRVDFKHRVDDDDGLGYQTMLRIGKSWFSPSGSSSVLRKIIKLILKQPGKNVSKNDINNYLTDKSDQRWYVYFKSFWDAVKCKYEPQGLWKIDAEGAVSENNVKGRKYHLYVAVVLEQFQCAFFKRLSGTYEDNFESKEFKEKLKAADSETSPEKIQEEREKIINEKFNDIKDRFLNKFAANRFERFRGSLNHSDGKKDLLDYFSKINEGNSLSNHPLITRE